MKVSLNWLEDYLNLDLSAREIADKLTELGLEANFTSRAKSFEGVVLGRVLECDPHPDADKLSVCKVDVGDDENYGIVDLIGSQGKFSTDSTPDLYINFRAVKCSFTGNFHKIKFTFL